MNRHRGLPAMVPRARVGFRLQPAPAAALPDQPFCPGSSRVLCHSRSGPLRAGSPPNHQDRGDRSPSVLALIGAWNAVLRCTLGFARRRLFSTQRTNQVCLRGGRSSTCLSPQQPFHSNPVLGCIVSLGAQHAMEKKKVLDGTCIVSLGLKFHSSVRQRTGSRISRGTGPSWRGTQRRRQTVPTAICAAGDYLRTQPVREVFSNQPCFQENLLCRAVWLCSRGSAETECAILPIRELAAYPRCSACEHPAQGSASLPATVLIDEFSWQPDRVPWYGSSGRADSPSSGRAESIHRTGFWETESACARRLLQPLTGERPAKGFLCVRHNVRRQHIDLTLFSSVCTIATCVRVRLPRPQTGVSLQATNCSRFSVIWWCEWWERGRGTVGTRKQPSLTGGGESRKRHLGPGHCLLLRQQTLAFVHPADAQNITHPSPTLLLCSLCAVADPCSPAGFRHRKKQQQSSLIGASQTLGRGRSGAEPAQERSQRAQSLLIQAALWAPSMADRDIILEALAEFPDPSETTPARWPWQAAPEHQCAAPKRDCRRGHRDGYQAQWCECLPK